MLAAMAPSKICLIPERVFAVEGAARLSADRLGLSVRQLPERHAEPIGVIASPSVFHFCHLFARGKIATAIAPAVVQSPPRRLCWFSRSFPDVPFKRFGQLPAASMRVASPRARVPFKAARFRAPKRKPGGLVQLRAAARCLRQPVNAPLIRAGCSAPRSRRGAWLHIQNERTSP
jgi:hypothetical protein